jgi:CPA1 family monovalent cation:H+ antiporter
MTLFQLFAFVTALVAVLGYINQRFLRLPETIGITALGLVLSMGITGYGLINPGGAEWAHQALASINFSEVLFHGVLGLLLFSGSLTLELGDMNRERGTIFVLATVGVILSTALVGGALYLIAPWIGIELSLLHCLLLGAVISPTDPVAVIGILKRVGMTRRMEMQIAGESLFNDGTGVVAVITVLALMGFHGHGAPHTEASAWGVALLLAQQALGAAILGMLIGLAGFVLLRGAKDSHTVSIFITLAMAWGGYALGEALGVSALITVIVAGLITGNHGRTLAMSAHTRAHLFPFWELVDQLLNLLLFGLIGIQVIAMQPSITQFLQCAMVVPIALAARWASVATPIVVMRRFRDYDPHTVTILTWGGLRGGLSVALALSLPAMVGRDYILGATYAVVIFSILVQALTLGPLIKHLRRRQHELAAHHEMVPSLPAPAQACLATEPAAEPIRTS